MATTNVESTNAVSAGEMERVYMNIHGNNNNIAVTSDGDSVVNGLEDVSVRKRDLTFSYHRNVTALTVFENELKIGELLSFVELLPLVEPNTTNLLSAKNVISIDGMYFTQQKFYDERYSLSLDDGSKLIFSGVYYNEGSGTTTSASTQHFSVYMGIGVFVGAKKVTVKYNSDGSRIITVSFN